MLSVEIIKGIIKIGQKISCAIRKIYGNSLGIPSNKMQEKTKWQPFYEWLAWSWLAWWWLLSHRAGLHSDTKMADTSQDLTRTPHRKARGFF